MGDIAQLHRELVARLLEGDGQAAPELRRAAFENANLSQPIRTLIEKVANRAYHITDQDVAAVRAAGLSEDQIFEIVICAAVGQASRQYTRPSRLGVGSADQGRVGGFACLQHHRPAGQHVQLRRRQP